MVVTMSFAGNTCNNMFQYAVLRIIAQKNNCDFYVPEIARQNLQKLFPQGLDWGVDMFEPKKIWYETPEQLFDPSILHVDTDTYMHGFFQTHKYFDGYEEFVQKLFPTVKTPAEGLCIVHYRGADYVGGWVDLPMSYYSKAMNAIKEQLPNVQFLIVTDDKAEAARRFPDINISNNEDFLEDFTLLVSAPYLILSNSSVSWWGGYLNQSAEIIAPKRWFNYRMNYHFGGLGKTEINREDWYPIDIKNNYFTFID